MRFLQRGITLIELMVVVLIIGILAVAVVPQLMGQADEAKVTAARADVATLMQQLKIYRLENGFYPSTDQGLQALVAKPTTNPVPANWRAGGYIERLPLDPWKRPYAYLNPGLRGEIDVFSLGADGQPGGEGAAADVGNWSP